MVEFAMDELFVQGKPGVGLLADPGLGKTATTLEILSMMRAIGEARRVLIVAPLRVIYSVWPEEIKKWHYPFKYSIGHGTPSERIKALNKCEDIFLINPHNVAWLSQFDLENRFDVLIVDESTEFKNWNARRSRAIRTIVKDIPKRIILTGTPAPNSLADMFSQVYILDEGERLGKTVTFFRNEYMRQGGFRGRQWLFKYNETKKLERAIADIIYRLDINDHLSMPEQIFNNVWIDLPTKVRARYQELENDLFMALDDDGGFLTVENGAAAYSSTRQISNGGIYETDEFTDERTIHHVHDVKVDAVQEIVDSLQGKPVLVAFLYQHDLERLLKRFPKTPFVMGGVDAKKSNKIFADWNEKKIPLLFVQPESAKYGLNLQAAGCSDLIWFGLTDNLLTYDQFNARIWRQGVRNNVRYHRILARNTVDEAVLDRIESKDANQTALLESLKKYREGRDERKS